MKFIAKRVSPLGVKCRPFLPKKLLSMFSFEIILSLLVFNLFLRCMIFRFARLLSCRTIGHEKVTLVSGVSSFMKVLSCNRFSKISSYVMSLLLASFVDT